MYIYIDITYHYIYIYCLYIYIHIQLEVYWNRDTPHHPMLTFFDHIQYWTHDGFGILHKIEIYPTKSGFLPTKMAIIWQTWWLSGIITLNDWVLSRKYMNHPNIKGFRCVPIVIVYASNWDTGWTPLQTKWWGRTRHNWLVVSRSTSWKLLLIGIVVLITTTTSTTSISIIIIIIPIPIPFSGFKKKWRYHRKKCPKRTSESLEIGPHPASQLMELRNV